MSQKLHVSLARDVIDKDQAGLRRATSLKTWRSLAEGYTVEEFIDAVTVTGSAWSYTFTGGKPTKTEFAGSNVLGLDFEDKGSGSFSSIDDLAADPFISTSAHLLYSTVSSKPGGLRARAIFVIPEVEKDGKKFEALLDRLLSVYPGQVDPACSDSARRFYGCRGADVRVLGNILNVENLPVAGSGVRSPAAQVPALTTIVEGSRNVSLFNIARGLVGRYPIETALSMVRGTNRDLSEPLPDDEVRVIVSGTFGRSDIVQNQTESERVVSEMNQKFALVWIGGKVHILDTSKNAIEFRQVDSFRNKFRNRKVMGPRGREVSVADLWLDHTSRRDFEKIVFNPRKEVPADEYNLFRGFAPIEPQDVPFDRIQYHIEEIVANGDAEVADWIVLFLAHLVRKPEEKPGVAISMRGGKGTGKGSFVRIVESLVGKENIVAVANREHLVGKFNRHLANKLVVFADEAFFAGSRDTDGVLKSFITEPKIQIEAKGVDAVTVDSFHRVIMAANDNWIHRASKDERRYLSTTLSDRHANEREYFDALYEAIPREMPGFLRLLLQVDLSKFNRFKAPVTETLKEQIDLTKDAFEQWVDEVKESGQIVLRVGRPGDESDRLLIDFSSPSKLVAEVDEVYRSYIEVVELTGGRHPIPKDAFGRDIARNFPGVERIRKRDVTGILKNFYRFKGKVTESEGDGELPF